MGNKASTNKTNGTVKNSILMSKMSLLRSRLLPLLRNGSQRSYMAGPGSRATNNRTPHGLTLENLKREWPLLTLFGIAGDWPSKTNVLHGQKAQSPGTHTVTRNS